ncbi:SPOR domain-containing protein [Mesorhizobium sp. PL10]
MADRTQLRAADNNDIDQDDPFAELTRIMGFDPRQPVKPQAPAVEKAADEGDFEIDLEKELMGEFGDDLTSMEVSQPAPEVHQPAAEIREPAFETADAAMDDALAASLDHDFVFDDAADHDFGVLPQAAAVAVEPAFEEPVFDDDFDTAVARSLENVSPLEDDLPMDDELAASLEQGLLLDDDATGDVAHVAEVAAPADDVAFDDDFDNAVSLSLEDELTLDRNVPAQEHYAVPAAEAPVHVVDAGDHAVADEGFAGHFEDAMADVDMDFAAQDFEPQAFEAQPVEAEDPEERDLDVSDLEASAPVEMDAPEADETPAWTAEAGPSHEAEHEAFDDFDLSIDDAVADQEPVAEVVAAPVQPAPVAPAYVAPAVVAPVVEATPAAPAADERTLEDELNALLGAMTTPRPVPVIEPTRAHEPVVPVQRSAAAPAAPADNLDWDLDEHAPAQAPQADAARNDADFGDLLAGELEGQEPEIEFDDHAFDAALAKGIDLGDDDTAAPVTGDWRSTPPEPARSWSRVTPTPANPSFAEQPQPSFAAPPQASFEEKPSMPPAAAPTYRDQPVAAAFVAPAPTREAPLSAYDEMPDVETVDVPERVVAIADDLDIPELSFQEDEPAAYDDIDAEFAGLLTDMNAVEAAPPPAATRSAAYDDESYSSGFSSGHELDQRAYAARPAEAPVAAAQPAYTGAAGGFDMKDLPGNRPVLQADDFAVDELDYDPDLDEAMAVPGLAEQEAARPRRSGLLVAGIVAAVAIAGGLGAFALSFGGKGGSDAPVIVKADNTPIKVKPENPGGAVVPNQDNKVYDAVAKGTKPAEPVQEKLVTNTEEPVDVKAQEPESRVVDLSPDDTDAAPGTDAAGNPDAAVAPAPKSEDRIAQVLQEADKNPDTVAVAPRKVRTMVVKPDGSLVAREDPTPAAPQIAAAEPLDPAPQHVAPSGDAEQTGTVAPAADQANGDQAGAETAKPVKPVKPAAAPKVETQSANTPQTVAVAPQRPSDQPVDVVGEVKPDQVASIPATAATSGGSWSMQIASQPTVESAQANYADLQRRYGNVLAGRTANIVKAEIAGKGTFYRVRVPAQSRNDAINLCTSYKAAGGNCFVSR